MPANRKDPFPAFCFRVTLHLAGNHDNATGFFRSVSGLKYEIEVSDYKEGGYNTGVRRLLGPVKWANIVLERGFSQNFALVEWMQRWINDPCKPPPCSGSIAQLDSHLDERCSWSFQEAWPCKWELSKLDAGKSELSIETLELAHEGLRFMGGGQ